MVQHPPRRGDGTEDVGRTLVVLHVAALGFWLLAELAAPVWLARERRRGPARELSAWRRLLPLLRAGHVSLLLLLASGLLLTLERGIDPGRVRWLALKLGLALFVIVPLEAMHAYVLRAFLASGLVATAGPPFSRDLERGISIDAMLRALAVPLLGLGLPLLVWLSVVKPL